MRGNGKLFFWGLISKVKLLTPKDPSTQKGAKVSSCKAIMCLQNQACWPAWKQTYQQWQVWLGQPGLCMPISSLQSLQALSILTSPSQGLALIAFLHLLLEHRSYCPHAHQKAKLVSHASSVELKGREHQLWCSLFLSDPWCLLVRGRENTQLCSSTDISSIITKKKSNFNATFRDHSHF